SEMGKAMMGTGEAEGERRAVDAAEAAISNPLLEDVSMKGARGVLINITGGSDMTLFEVDEAANRIREEVDPEANIIFGSTFDESLNGRMRISVVATGIDAELAKEVRPALSLVSSRPAAAVRPAARDGSRGDPYEATSGSYTQPMLTQNAAHQNAAVAAEAPRAEPPPPRDGSRGDPYEEPLPQMAEAAEAAALKSGAFIAPKAVEPGPGRPVPLTQPAVPPAAAPKPKGRVPSLIERVTGVGRARAQTPPPPAPREGPYEAPRPAAPPVKPGQVRLASPEPEDRPALSKEDDLLDIPAFLRRQAN
ncbi:MAG TPA: cell division protein FtsZ, partial [Stellaceae bacterium]|nr:cell division protein FtsZ [Stellaceae bacterium]